MTKGIVTRTELMMSTKNPNEKTRRIVSSDTKTKSVKQMKHDKKKLYDAIHADKPADVIKSMEKRLDKMGVDEKTRASLVSIMIKSNPRVDDHVAFESKLAELKGDTLNIHDKLAVEHLLQSTGATHIALPDKSIWNPHTGELTHGATHGPPLDMIDVCRGGTITGCVNMNNTWYLTTTHQSLIPFGPSWTQ